MACEVRATRRHAVERLAAMLVVAACRTESASADGTTEASTSSSSAATSSVITEAASASADSSGGASSTSSDSSAGSSGESSTTGAMDTPPPVGRRWVLRDSDGVAVDAVVEPTCRSSLSVCLFPEIGHVGPISPECVRVLQLGSQYIDIAFHAQTGRPENCIRSTPTPVFAAAYPTADCALPGYTVGGAGTGDVFEWRRRPFVLEDDTVLFESRDAPHIDLDAAFGWNDAEVCEAIPFFIGTDLAPWFALPDAVANALPNPPYTLSWE